MKPVPKVVGAAETPPHSVPAPSLEEPCLEDSISVFFSWHFWMFTQEIIKWLSANTQRNPEAGIREQRSDVWGKPFQMVDRMQMSGKSSGTGPSQFEWGLNTKPYKSMETASMTLEGSGEYCCITYSNTP